MGSEDDPKRTRILEAAYKLFALHGFQKTTIADIAKAVHIGKATIYSYFENKEAIFAGVLDGITAAYGRRVEQAVAAASSHEDKLRSWASTQMEFSKEIMQEAAPLTDEALFELLPMAAACRAEGEQREIALLERVIAAAKADGVFHVQDPASAATALIVAMRGIDPIHRRFFDPPNLEHAMREIVEWFIRGFKAPVEMK